MNECKDENSSALSNVDWSNAVSRRIFMKRTGAASVAALAATYSMRAAVTDATDSSYEWWVQAQYGQPGHQAVIDGWKQFFMSGGFSIGGCKAKICYDCSDAPSAKPTSTVITATVHVYSDSGQAPYTGGTPPPGQTGDGGGVVRAESDGVKISVSAKGTVDSAGAVTVSDVSGGGTMSSTIEDDNGYQWRVTITIEPPTESGGVVTADVTVAIKHRSSSSAPWSTPDDVSVSAIRFAFEGKKTHK